MKSELRDKKASYLETKLLMDKLVDHYYYCPQYNLFIQYKPKRFKQIKRKIVGYLTRIELFLLTLYLKINPSNSSLTMKLMHLRTELYGTNSNNI